ncbi:MAG: ABC transporter permease [Nitrososphaerota archaeon]|nr:ABC transporter permease [Nitrososphaerota archaeon]MDG7037847.1 ABC transporter permease [Nitrososphaerota archaeon]MDG7040118.1 ABC transporter permease [Nitrososphaerota archaeon]MDG7042047.1 ABC transporter permease [Nitrososphaerota archaeon]MDG7043503.1 ABC transporter permease [Nitrososphaerota archaeon]
MNSSRLQIIFFIFLGLIVSSFTFTLFNLSPISGLLTLFSGGFGSFNALAQTFVMSTPLLIIGVGLAVPFQAKFWNIGAQGQFILGEIFATWVGLELASSLPPLVVILVSVAFGFVGGALWAIPPTLMKLYAGANEIITTLMMNFVAVYLLTYLLAGPMEGAEAKMVHAPSSAPLPAADLLPHIGTLSVGIFLAIAIALILYVILKRTNFGYELMLIGQSLDNARYSGVTVKRNILLSMIISGGIAGIAGMIMVFGSTQALIPQFFSDVSTSFGYVGIAVAMISSLNPLAIIIISIFFGGILNGSYIMEAIYSTPIDVVISIYGILMFFTMIGILIDFSKYFRRKKVK